MGMPHSTCIPRILYTCTTSLLCQLGACRGSSHSRTQGLTLPSGAWWCYGLLSRRGQTSTILTQNQPTNQPDIGSAPHPSSSVSSSAALGSGKAAATDTASSSSALLMLTLVGKRPRRPRMASRRPEGTLRPSK